MMKKILYFIFVLCSVTFTACVDEVLLSTTPTIPTTLNIEDGYVTTDTIISLQANGSTANADVEIKYKYYLSADDEDYICVGSDAGALRVKLMPFTQYKWYAKAVPSYSNDKTEESEPTEIRTFYCIPQAGIELFRSFGDDENSTTIKWNIGYYKSDNSIQKLPLEKFKQANITIDILSVENQSNIKSIELAGDADSVYIRPKDVNNNVIYNIYDTNDEQKELLYVAAYKYKFNVKIDIPVGDKVVNLTQSIESILVDNNTYAIDKELNIYRTIPIGDDRWAIDNLRLSKCSIQSFTIWDVDNKGVNFMYFIGDDSKIKLLNDNYIINGYHVSTGSDWERLEQYFGIEYGVETFSSTYDAQLAFEKEDESTYSLSKYFATKVPWEVFSDEKISEGNYLNSFNVHSYGLDKDFADHAVIFYVNDGKERIISKKYKSIALAKYLNYINRTVIRLVKDKE